MMRRSTAPVLCLLLCAGWSCGPSQSIDQECERGVNVGRSSGELSAALAKAEPGDCLLLDGGEYQGAFDIPAGVQLVGTGTERFLGDDLELPALRLRGGEGSGLRDVSVVEALGPGLLVDGGPALVARVSVERARNVGIVVRCLERICEDASREVVLREVTARNNNIGLWVRGARVQLEGGLIAEQSGEGLTDGYGILITESAQVAATKTEVRGNVEGGMVIDGAATRVQLEDVAVIDNLGRGIWAQGLRGTLSEPRLEIRGSGSRIEGNRLVGLGATDAQGIIIIECLVAQTAAVTVPTDLGAQASIGDGIALFAETAEVSIERSVLRGNARAQGLIDQGGAGIIIIECVVAPEAGLYGLVMQQTPLDNFDAPPDAISKVEEDLPIASGALALPGIR